LEAFRWTSAGGLVGLGDLPGGASRSEANAVSADGSVIVGYDTSASGIEAFRWTSAGGMVGLGDLPGGIFDSEALAVSADGSIVVGRGDGSAEPFIWDAVNGMRSLSTVLTDLGLDLSGWDLRTATGISADGSTIVGDGVYNEVEQAWIAVIPEPGTGLLLMTGLLGLAYRQRRRRPAA
jgi:probable HAF family extracellular repeat protein